MALRGRYSSPDGALVLVVDEADGDLAVAFEGFEWHTHGDLLVPYYGATEIEAVEAFVDRVLSDQLVIAVSRRGDAISDVRVTEDPADEHAHASEGEQILLRLWSGRPWMLSNKPLERAGMNAPRRSRRASAGRSAPMR